MRARLIHTLAVGLAVLAGPVVAQQGQPAASEPVDPLVALFDSARAEVSRLQKLIQRQEAEITALFNETQRAVQLDETAARMDVQLGVARRYLSEHPVVREMDTPCQNAYSRLSETTARSDAIACIKRAPLVRDLPTLFSCSSLTLESAPTGLSLTGYVSKETDMAALRAQFGERVTAAVKMRPYPLCKTLDTLGFTDTMEPRPEVLLLSRASAVPLGGSLAFDVVTPTVPSFLYLIYMQADDTVVNLLPKRGPLRRQYPPGTRLRFGDGVEDPRVFTAAPPLGPEAILAISARSPLDGLDAFETGQNGEYLVDGQRLANRAEFLEQLDLALADFNEQTNGRREISFDLLYVQITN